MTVRIAQISDTHVSPAKPFFHDNMALIAEHLRETGPDLVINTGDVSLDGADSDEDLEAAVAAHADLEIETLLLPGNHDVGDDPNVVRARQPADTARLARWRRIVGDDHFVMDIPGWRLIGANALILGADLPEAEAQRETIAKAVRDAAGRAIALFLHKPVADLDMAEGTVSNRFLSAEARAGLLGAFGALRPALALCGHVHQYRVSSFGDVRHIWAPAVSFVISDPWQPGYGAKCVGYLEHRFHADGTHDHALIAPRGLVHHDLVAFPDAYGDVRRWGEGKA